MQDILKRTTCLTFLSPLHLKNSSKYYKKCSSLLAMSIQKTNRYALKGFFTNFLLALKSHILDSNGVWYRHSWFWSEGSINTPNWTKDLDWQCHRLSWGPTSLWVKNLDSRSFVQESTSFGVVSRGPLWCRESRSPGIKFWTKIFEFGAFIDLNHTRLLSKICDLSAGEKLWTIPLIESLDLLILRTASFSQWSYSPSSLRHLVVSP